MLESSHPLICDHNTYVNFCHDLINLKKKQKIIIDNNSGYPKVIYKNENSFEKFLSNEKDIFNCLITFFNVNVINSPELKKTTLEALHSIKAIYHYNGKSNKVIEKLQKGINKIERIQSKKLKNIVTIKIEQEMGGNIWWKLKKDEAKADLEIICKDGTLKTYSLLLTQIAHFKSGENYAENDSKEWDLRAFPKECISLFLDFIYLKAHDEPPSLGNIMWVFCLTDYLDIKGLNKCLIERLEEIFNEKPDIYADAVMFYYYTLGEQSQDQEVPTSFPLQIIYDQILRQHAWKWKRVSHEKQEEATSLVKTFSDLGYPQAQALLGHLYQLNTEKIDFEEVISLYQSAIEHNDPLALNNLGVLFLNGIGLKQDENRGAELCKKACEQGYAPAQNNLAECYELGVGVEKDLDQAEMLYKLSSEQGYAFAQYNLVAFYRDRNDARKS